MGSALVSYVLFLWVLWPLSPSSYLTSGLQTLDGVSNLDRLNHALEYQYEHSLSQPYHQEGGACWRIPYWDYGGNTVITKEFVRLTGNKPGQSGLLWNTQTLDLKNWEVRLHFEIHGSEIKENEPNSYQNPDPGNTNPISFPPGFSVPSSSSSSGLVFWYTKEQLRHGPVFGARDFFSGLAIFVENPRQNLGPYSFIYYIVNNGTSRYERPFTELRDSSCRVKIPEKSDPGNWLKIRYARNTLEVWVKPAGSKGWMDCFTLKDADLPMGYYLGVSGATGHNVDLSGQYSSEVNYHHDILEIQTFSVELDERESSEEISFQEETQESVAVPVVDLKMIPVSNDEKPPVFPASAFVMPLVVLLVIVTLCVTAAQIHETPSERERQLYLHKLMAASK